MAMPFVATWRLSASTVFVLAVASCMPVAPVIPGTVAPSSMPAGPVTPVAPVVGDPLPAAPPAAPLAETQATLLVAIPADAVDKLRAEPGFLTQAWRLLAGPGDLKGTDFDRWQVLVNGAPLPLADRTVTATGWDVQGRFTATLLLRRLGVPAPWRVALINRNGTFRLETRVTGPGAPGGHSLTPESTARLLLEDRLAAIGKAGTVVPDEAVTLLTRQLEVALAGAAGDPLATSPLFTLIQNLTQALTAGVPGSALATHPGIAPAPSGGGGGGAAPLGPPAVAGFTPVGGAGVGMAVTITGTDLTGATAVSFNGTNQPTFTVASNTRITTTVPAGATTGTIQVTTPLGAAASGPFTVIPSPTVTGFAPVGGAGVGMTVTLTGTNLTGATAVRFNGTNQPTFTVDSATQITTTVPAGANTGTIQVDTPGGTATSGSFTVIPTPTIASFTPAGGAFITGGTSIGATVTITGTNLTGATAVTFNGTNQGTFTVVNATTVTTTVPAGATTGPIQVTTPGGTATSGVFTVLPTPLYTAITSGQPHLPGVPLQISGTNLTGATQARYQMGTSPIAVGASAATFVIVPTPNNLPGSGVPGVPMTYTFPVFIDYPGGSLLVPAVIFQVLF